MKMIFRTLLTTLLLLVFIQVTESQSECVPDGGDCTRDCECCGEKSGTICIQRAKDRAPKCFRSNCKQVGHVCLDNSECCSQMCKDGNCKGKIFERVTKKYVFVDLLSKDDIKAVADLNIDNEVRKLSSGDLVKYNSATSTIKIITVGEIIAVHTMPSVRGYLKYLVMRTDSTNEKNDPTSFQIFGECRIGDPTIEITQERRVNLPARRGVEKWFRIVGKPDCETYTIQFSNDKGNSMEINFQLKAKIQIEQIS